MRGGFFAVVAWFGWMGLFGAISSAAAATWPVRPAPVVETAYLLDRVPEDGPDASRPAADPAALLTRADWTPYVGVLTLGYGSEPYWIRLTIRRLEGPGPWVLRMRPSFLDEVRVYRLRPGGLQEGARLGDAVPPDPAALHDTALAFRVEAEPGQTQAQYLVQVRTTSARMARIWVQDWVRADQQRDLESTLIGLYFGVMVGVLVWGAFHALMDRDAVFAGFVAYEGATVMMNVGLLGHARLYLPDGWSPDRWTTGWVLALGLVGPWFHWLFLRAVMGGSRLPWPITGLLGGAAAVALLNLFQAAIGRVGPALATNATLVAFLAFLLALAVVGHAWRRPSSPLRRLLGTYSLHCLLVMMTLLPLLGLWRGGDWTLFSTSAHGLFLALVLAAALTMRRREQQQAAQRARDHLTSEQARTRQALAQRDEKDRFLSMLTHELRTPLSVIRMVLDGARRREASESGRRQLGLAQGAAGDIDQVIERTLMVDRMERQAFVGQWVDCDVAEVLSWCVAAAEHQGTRVELECTTDPVILRSDPVLLRLILSNLVDNALKYAAVGSPVMVRLTGEGGLNLRVCNQPGRAGRPDLRRVFDKYYRSEGAQHSTGSGQGLYLVAGLARQLGLSIRCDPGRDEKPDSPVCFELRTAECVDGPVDPDR